MSNTIVVRTQHDSESEGNGEWTVTVRRHGIYRVDRSMSPDVDDLPDDVREALLDWIEGRNR